MMKFLILILVSTVCFANSMLFEVETFDLKRQEGAPSLVGEAYARDIYIKYDAVEFDLTQNGELFLVDVALYNNKFSFRKDTLNLTTYIPTLTEIDYLDFIYANQATIEFADSGFHANGPQLSIGADQFLFDIRNVKIDCDSDSFTFRLDKICLKNMLIEPSDEDKFAQVEIKQKNQETSFISILGKKVLFANERINIDAEHVSGNILNSDITFKSINVDCYKDQDLNSFDLNLIFSGCLRESEIAGKEIKMLREGRPFEVYDGKVYFNKAHVGVNAKQLLAETQKGVFTFYDIQAKCLKYIPKSLKLTADAFYVGCLENSYFEVDRIDEDKVELDNNRISNLRLLISEGKFNLSAKFRALFKLNFKASGNLVVDEMDRQIKVKVNKAKIAGMRVTKLVLRFVMKFINSDSVSLKGDTIIIKY